MCSSAIQVPNGEIHGYNRRQRRIFTDRESCQYAKPRVNTLLMATWPRSYSSRMARVNRGNIDISVKTNVWRKVANMTNEMLYPYCKIALTPSSERLVPGSQLGSTARHGGRAKVWVNAEGAAERRDSYGSRMLMMNKTNVPIDFQILNFCILVNDTARWRARTCG